MKLRGLPPNKGQLPTEDWLLDTKVDKWLVSFHSIGSYVYYKADFHLSQYASDQHAHPPTPPDTRHVVTT